MRGACLLLLLVACKTESKSAPADTAADASKAFSAESHSRAKAIATVVRAWNEANNAHDVSKLADVYASEVELYAKKMPRADALDAKTASFTTHESDELSNLRIDEGGRVLFTRKSKSKDGKVALATSYLDCDRSGDVWKIVSEGDVSTDANQHRKHTMTCMGAVSALVDATPQARKAMTEIKRLAGMTNEPTDSRTGLWHLALCETSGDRFLCLDHFDVDPTSAAITYTGVHQDLGTNPTPDPQLASAVEAACK